MEKVVYINDKDIIVQGDVKLTIGKIYTNVSNSDTVVVITDDAGSEVYVHRKRFITLDKYREQQLTKILDVQCSRVIVDEDGYYYLNNLKIDTNIEIINQFLPIEEFKIKFPDLEYYHTLFPETRDYDLFKEVVDYLKDYIINKRNKTINDILNENNRTI